MLDFSSSLCVLIFLLLMRGCLSDFMLVYMLLLLGAFSFDYNDVGLVDLKQKIVMRLLLHLFASICILWCWITHFGLSL